MANGIDPLYNNAWTDGAARRGARINGAANATLGQPLEAPRTPDELARADDDSLDRWMMLAADTLGIEAEPITAYSRRLNRLRAECRAHDLKITAPRIVRGARFWRSYTGGTRPTIIDANLRAHR